MGMMDFLLKRLKPTVDVGEIKERSHDSGGYYNSRDPLSEYYEQKTDIVNERSKVYKDMDDLDNDIISTVLDMGADDATQTDLGTGKSLWCASDDPKYKDTIDKFFSRIKIEEKLWRWARETYKYGDFFLKINPGEGRIKSVDDTLFPQQICRIESYGTLVAFLDKSVYENAPHLDSSCLLPPYSIIHFRTPRYRIIEDCLPKEIYEKFEIDRNPLYGSSTFLKARKIEKRISLINDALAMTRLARSTLYRVHSVNVGDLTNVNQRKKVMSDYENTIRKSPGINLDRDKASIDVKGLSFFRELFIPKDNEGKGQSEINDIGGNADVTGIADVDFLNSQRFGIIGVPKTYLSFDEAQSFNNLIALDTRYARKIVSLQKAMISGITALCQVELALHDLDPDTSKFAIHLVPVSTNGELDRNDALNAVIDICNDIKTFFDLETVDKDYLVKYLVTNYLKFPNMDMDLLFKKTDVPAETETTTDTETAEAPAAEPEPPPAEAEAPKESKEKSIEQRIEEKLNELEKKRRRRISSIEPSELDLYETEQLKVTNRKLGYDEFIKLKK